MRRKIVKHGNSTLTVSIPQKWAKEHNIKQGDELNLDEKPHSIVLTTDIRVPEKELEIDLSGTAHMLHRAIAALYKGGYDKLSIKYRNSEELDRIQDTIYKYCHVYEITGIDKDCVHIKAISQLKPKHFDQMLERMCLASMNIARGSLESMKNNDYEQLAKFIIKDNLVDRYAAYCSRIINKGWELDYRKGPLYYILDATEIASDIFKTLNSEIIAKKPKLSREFLEFLQKTIDMMEIMFNMISSFNIYRVKEIGQRESDIRKSIDELCEKEDPKIAAYAINLFETVFEMKSAVMALNI